MEKHNYRTVLSLGKGFYSEKGSKFYAVAKHVRKREEVTLCLKKTEKRWADASHYCSAYRLISGEEYGSDAGEPSGSAGPVILNQIKKRQLENVAVIVTRYYGGTNLGIPGLIRSYKNAVANALENSSTGIAYIKKIYKVQLPHTRSPHFLYGCEKTGTKIVEKKFGENAEFIIAVLSADEKNIKEEIYRRTMDKSYSEELENFYTFLYTT